MTAIAPPDGLTPTQRKVLAVLADGYAHPKWQLIECLWDGDEDAIKVMISKIRKHVRPHGLDILCVFEKRQFMYRLVRLTSNPYNGLK